MKKDANVAGQAYAFMAMTPIGSGDEPALRARLEGLGRELFDGIGRTHFARFVIVTDYVNDPEQPHEDHLEGPHLVFTSNLDGPLDTYLDTFCARPEAREIYGREGADLKRHLLDHQVDTGFFFAPYGATPLPEVRKALHDRDQLIDFAIRAQRMAPGELRAAFLAERFR